jgi:hypothetical protein
MGEVHHVADEPVADLKDRGLSLGPEVTACSRSDEVIE